MRVFYTGVLSVYGLPNDVFVFAFRAQFRADYEALQARMYSLPDKLTHDVMV